MLLRAWKVVEYQLGNELEILRFEGEAKKSRVSIEQEITEHSGSTQCNQNNQCQMVSYTENADGSIFRNLNASTLGIRLLIVVINYLAQQSHI